MGIAPAEFGSGGFPVPGNPPFAWKGNFMVWDTQGVFLTADIKFGAGWVHIWVSVANIGRRISAGLR